MMQKLILLLVVICPLLLSQPTQNFILSECNFIPTDSAFQLYYSYRIPYNRIVFEKNPNGYYASYRLNVEVFDSTGKFLTRGMAEKKLTVNSYEESVSRNLFTEGLLKFDVEQTSLTIIPIFTDLITNTESRTLPIEIRSIERESDFLSPLIVENQTYLCNNNAFPKLANYGGVVPFDTKTFNLIIPAPDLSINALNCVILNNEDTVFNSTINNGIVKELTYMACDNSVILTSVDAGKKFKLFILKNISDKLEVGTLTILLSSNEKFEKKNTFRKEVRWFNKPFILNNQELSSKVLKYIEDENIISDIRGTDEEKFLQKLLHVWEKYDPTKETKYNELMEQYFSRVDYTIRNFSTISGKQGWDTDRGAIYIQYGNPDEIKRASDDHGKVIEAWIYNNPDKKFNFVDKTGTGEFVILSQK